MAPVRRNPTLPNELISQILIRVPVKSLLQYQSVSKTWLSMIKNPSFVKSQLRHALTTQTDDQTLLKAYRSSVLHLDSGRNVAYLKFPFPRRDDVMYLNLVGSANGIVCVSVEFGSHDDYRNTSICLWNPATTQSKFLPSSFNASVRVLGFGYDGVDDDYKIVAYVDNYVVYSDNRNAWRIVPETVHSPGMDGFDVCINGFLCGSYGGTYAMMAFDLNREVLNCHINLPVTDDQPLLDCTIKLPVMNVINDAHDYSADDDFARIIEFNNSVAVIMMIGSSRNINMWTLDDDACLRVGGVRVGGIEASWTPVLSIDTRMRPDQFYGYFSNGNLILLLTNYVSDVKMWISCNVDKKEAKFAPPLLDMAEHCQDSVIFKYKESLISLAAGFRHVN